MECDQDVRNELEMNGGNPARGLRSDIIIMWLKNASQSRDSVLRFEPNFQSTPQSLRSDNS